MPSDWNPSGWRSHEARQQPLYPDPEALASATRELSAYPPLVSRAEARLLEAAIAEAQSGRAFLLQGGDCAESFAEFSPENIRAMHRLFAGIAEALTAASGLPVIRLARIAGQFAKPRSSETEAKDGVELPTYRGDIVNGIGFEAPARRPDPERMFRAYSQSAATLAHLRSLAQADGAPIYTGHEALLLPYEEALVRTDPTSGESYGSSAHFLWVGDRTRFAGSAHVEFLRGLANPLGVKCGPGLEPDDLLRLLDRLNPNRKRGRITLIARMGSDKVELRLPPLLRAVRAEGHPVLWSCDPMHGNTIKASNGYKTRPLARIFAEVSAFFAICRSEDALPGGVHVEMTGRNVTECTGGLTAVTEQNLADRYHTHCDPRLNPTQAMELAGLLAETLRKRPGAEAA
jgi:3-deoxy-7-phosphoheptulonate synthase